MKRYRALLLLCALLLPPWKLSVAAGGEITREIFYRQMDESSRIAHAVNPAAELGWIVLELTRSGRITESEFRFYYANNLPLWERLLHEVTGIIAVEYYGNGKPVFSDTVQSIKNSGGRIELSLSEKAMWMESLEIVSAVARAYVDYYKVKAGFSIWMTSDSWQIRPRSFSREVQFPYTLIFFSSRRREVVTFSKEFADYLSPLLKDRNLPVIVR